MCNSLKVWPGHSSLDFQGLCCKNHFIPGSPCQLCPSPGKIRVPLGLGKAVGRCFVIRIVQAALTAILNKIYMN